MDSSLTALIASGLGAAAIGVWLGRRVARQRAEALSAGVRQVTAAIARAAAAECAEILRAGEINGAEEARAAGAVAEVAQQKRADEIDARVRRLGERQAAQTVAEARANDSRERAATARARVAAHDAEAARLKAQAAAAGQEVRAALEAAAGLTAQAAAAAIREGELEEARLVAARFERGAGEAANEGAGRAAKRTMGIAMGRFSGHYLTERLHSVLPLPGGEAGTALIGPDQANLRA
ncbi:MAG TPA: hypothetical protein VLA79_08840, partial [Polyangia bacterium]|nr:hypothetical protein [Polyangia bacterium]